MKTYLFAILIFCNLTLYGQIKDQRAEVEIKGGIEEISVSPDEKIWLTALDKVYFANNINSNWHKVNIDKKENNNQEDFTYGVHYSRISFFNKDTAILSGAISKSTKYSMNNGIYITFDGGKNWELQGFGGDSRIYCSTTDENGNAWLGGLNKKLYYTKNFGKSWISKKLPFKTSDRTYCIYMKDSKHGILSSESNEILVTYNNWSSAKIVETPMDQEKITTDKFDRANFKQIIKAQIWKNWFVVIQGERIFYSDSQKIKWEQFPIKLVDFEVDKESNLLFAVTKDLGVVVFSKPSEYEELTIKKLRNAPIDIKVVNHSLYIISAGLDVHKINSNEFIQTPLFTDERKIPNPSIIQKSGNLLWGMERNQIYLYEKSSPGWYRENILAFKVEGFYLQDDSTAILWDNSYKNYKYSLKTHSIEKHYAKNLLNSFLSSPINSVIIYSTSHGCYHAVMDKILYEKLNDSTLYLKSYQKFNKNDESKQDIRMQINISDLSNLLTEINSNPMKVPQINEFDITKADIDSFFVDLETQSLLFSRIKYGNPPYDYCKNVVQYLDTIGIETMMEIIGKQSVGWSTTENTFNIIFKNQNNEEIEVFYNYYDDPKAWFLPWVFKVNGQYFTCPNLGFSQYINKSIPDDFMNKEIFGNSLLLTNIVNYFWVKKARE